MNVRVLPGSYVWNLGVAATLNSGGPIEEVDRACRPIRELAAQGSDVGTAQFMAAWAAVADQVEEQTVEAGKAGHLRTAGQRWARAAPSTSGSITSHVGSYTADWIADTFAELWEPVHEQALTGYLSLRSHERTG